METRFVEIPVSEARPGDIAVLRGEDWPSEVRAEVYENDRCLRAAGWVVRFSDVDPGATLVRFERAVPVLPAEPTSVIRASAADASGRHVAREVMVLDADGYWVDSTGYPWRPKDIDLSTVEVGRVVFDEEVRND